MSDQSRQAAAPRAAAKRSAKKSPAQSGAPAAAAPPATSPASGPRAAKDGGVIEFAGVRMTSPAKLLYQQPDISKLDLAKYYQQIAEWILPLVLLAIPGRTGLLMALAYTGLTVIEYLPFTTATPLVAALYVGMVTGRWLLTLLVAVLAARQWHGGRAAVPALATG